MKTHLTEYLDDTLERMPHHIAIIDGLRKIDFQFLGKNVKSLACILMDQFNAVLNRPVGVYLEKSIESVIADIGILYSGNAYMNLDVKTPQQRIASIIQLIHPVAIVTTSKWAEQLPQLPEDVCLIQLDQYDLDIETYDTSLIKKHLSNLIDTDPSCIINTSGSTGIPKGVVLNHKSFFDFTEWAFDTLLTEKSEIIGSLSPIVFDIYSFELCMLMAKGSTLVVIPETYAAFPAKIMELLQKEKVNFIFWVPTIMVNIANMGLLDKFSLDELRMIWFAGEVFPTKQLNIWRKALPRTCFVNLYGPIEITLDCTYFVFDRLFQDNESIPIGFPCRNTDVILLDEEDHLVTDPFLEGELCVRGTSLAMGYYNNPEKTAEAFVQNPLNHTYPELIYRTGDIACYNDRGELMFKGRKDTLIKHSGYRIELGEIEHVIVNMLKLVKNGCAVYDAVQKKIVFYYESDTEISVQEWRKSIGIALPKYMIPAEYIQQEILPRNTNGKIDRLKLKQQLTEISRSNRRK